MAGVMSPACSIEEAHVHRHCCYFVVFAGRQSVLYVNDIVMRFSGSMANMLYRSITASSHPRPHTEAKSFANILQAGHDHP